jgi:hypothetical protein
MEEIVFTRPSLASKNPNAAANEYLHLNHDIGHNRGEKLVDFVQRSEMMERR